MYLGSHLSWPCLGVSSVIFPFGASEIRHWTWIFLTLQEFGVGGNHDEVDFLLNLKTCTPPKTNEPKNEGSEDDFPFQSFSKG